MSRPPIEVLDWDTRFFGRRIARVKADQLSVATVSAVLAECVKQRIECLYFLARSNDPASWRAAEVAGFGLMDMRVTFARNVDSMVALTVPGLNLRLARARSADVPSLKRIAAGLYQESRFAVDPAFPRDAAPRLFSEWVSRSVQGRFDDVVLIAREGRTVAGFISCRRGHRKPASIGLVGVARGYQGKGVGQFLVQESLDWFRQQRETAVQVVTQGANIAAQRLYEKCGFRSQRVDLWYHKWFLRSISR